MIDDNPKWIIAGEPGGKPQVGEVFFVRHSRKGNFKIRVTQVNGYWLTGMIVEGVAKANMRYNVAYEGEEVTIRDVHTHLSRVTP